MKSFHLPLLVALLAAARVNAQDGWLNFRGDLQRTGSAAKLKPWDKRVAWQRPLLMDKLDGFPDAEPEDAAKALIEKLRRDADPTILPGAFPIIVGDTCNYATYRSIVSVAVQPITFLDKESDTKTVVKAGEITWKSIPQNRSLSMMLEKNNTRPAMNKIVEMLQETKQDRWLWANPTIGSLSSDGKTVFTVNDSVFPAIEIRKLTPLPRGLGEIIRPFLMQSDLIAYHARHGKGLWDADGNDFDREQSLVRSYFLGAPVSHAGKLFGVNEKKDELRLLRIDPAPKEGNFNINLETTLAIAKIPAAEQIPLRPLRRTQPLHIALAGDTLVCPTHAGVIVGVERAKMAVRWTYRYREETTAPPALPHWQAACPIVGKDRIVFTAADAPEVHCLDFDGKKQWSAARDDGLYLATVHDDIVFLVGKKDCRALNLKDGTEKWRIAMGLPAGVGVKDGATYYLPLKVDADTKGPTLWAIDLAKGKKVERLAVPYPDALGNLALHRGLFVSQSVTHVAAFPLAAVSK